MVKLQLRLSFCAGRKASIDMQVEQARSTYVYSQKTICKSPSRLPPDSTALERRVKAEVVIAHARLTPLEARACTGCHHRACFTSFHMRHPHPLTCRNKQRGLTFLKCKRTIHVTQNPGARLCHVRLSVALRSLEKAKRPTRQ
jgi:hypothetical protein